MKHPVVAKAVLLVKVVSEKQKEYLKEVKCAIEMGNTIPASLPSGNTTNSVWVPWKCDNCESLRIERFPGHLKSTILGKYNKRDKFLLIKNPGDIKLNIIHNGIVLSQTCRKCAGKPELKIIFTDLKGNENNGNT